MKVLVIGGTSFIGRLLVAELLKAGHEVTVLHRRAKHDLGKRVQNLVADRNDQASVRAALRFQSFQVVFDNAYDWERGTTSSQVEGTAQAVMAACGDRLSHYVFMSSVAAYGDGLNHHDGDPLAPDDHLEPYVRNKAMSERTLFRMHHTGLPVVTLRPPFVYGPENPFYREAFFWDRLRDNRPIILPGDGHRLMQFVYVKDLVRACLRAMEEPGAVGEAFNVANEKPVTQFEFLQAMAAAAGKKSPNIVRVPRERIAEAGGDSMGQPAYFGVYLDVPPITEVVVKAKRILGFQPTPFDIGLKETYRWYLRNSKKSRIDYSFENRLIEMASVAPAGD